MNLPNHRTNRKPITVRKTGATPVMKITLFIGHLMYGGAQRQLVELAKGLHKRGHSIVVIVCHAGEPLEKDLHNAGVRLEFVYRGKPWNILGFFLRLRKTIARAKPDVLHGYLEMPNIFSTLLRSFFPGMRVVWGVRNSDIDLRPDGWMAGFVFKCSCLLAHTANLIIVNSNAGLDYHVRRGYPAGKMAVVPNGIDTNRFCPDPEARQRMRGDWNIRQDDILIGLVGRQNPMKDHPTFLQAAARLVSEEKDAHVRFVCVGAVESVAYQQELKRLGRDLERAGRLIWAGSYYDMTPIYNALDIMTSSSAYGEGFANAVGEAMACGTPCVVTDVGDSAWIVGEAGRVIPPRDVDALVAAWRELIHYSAQERQALGSAARQRILERFSVDKLAERSEQVFSALLS